MIAIGGTGIFTIVYMGVGLPTTFALDDGYGYLPTYNLSLKDGNDHMYISLIYFCCITFIEGLCLAYFLDQMRLIKKDFNMLQELQIFTLCWVLLTEFVLFMIIQGLSAEWMTNVQYYRLMFYVILLRQLLIVLATTAKPIYQAFKNSVYFAIPANHECIDSVDMVLHIPIAVDAFYQYLISRHEHMKDKQAIHLIALYIDLRLYDKECSDNVVKDDSEIGKDEQLLEQKAEILDERRRIAEDIYEQYLSEEAQRHRNSDIET